MHPYELQDTTIFILSSLQSLTNTTIQHTKNVFQLVTESFVRWRHILIKCLNFLPELIDVLIVKSQYLELRLVTLCASQINFPCPYLLSRNDPVMHPRCSNVVVRYFIRISVVKFKKHILFLLISY